MYLCMGSEVKDFTGWWSEEFDASDHISSVAFMDYFLIYLTNLLILWFMFISVLE